MAHMSLYTPSRSISIAIMPKALPSSRVVPSVTRHPCPIFKNKYLGPLHLSTGTLLLLWYYYYYYYYTQRYVL